MQESIFRAACLPPGNWGSSTPPLSSSCTGWLLHPLLLCRPLVMPPSCSLLILSLCRPLVVSSHQLVVAFSLVALPSCHHLTLLLSCRLAPAGCCIASCRAALLLCCPLILSSSSTLNSLSLGFPDAFDVTFMVKIDRGGMIWLSQRGGACDDRKSFFL